MPLNSSFLAGQCEDIWSKKNNFGQQSSSTIWSACYAQVKSSKCMQRAHAVTICLKYNMHVKACPKRMFGSWQLPDHRSQKSAIHSQANQASTARMWSFCMSLQLVWGFPPHKTTTKVTATRELPLDVRAQDRPCVQAWLCPPLNPRLFSSLTCYSDLQRCRILRHLLKEWSLAHPSKYEAEASQLGSFA